MDLYVLKPIYRYCNSKYSTATGTHMNDAEELLPNLFTDDVICAGDEVIFTGSTLQVYMSINYIKLLN